MVDIYVGPFVSILVPRGGESDHGSRIHDGRSAHDPV